MIASRIGRVFLILLWGLLALGSAEMICRVVLFPEYTAMLPDMYIRHPVLGHYNKPNLSVRRFNPMNYDVMNHTNSFGMRGLEKNREQELSGIWIAGGSNSFGGYVDDDKIFSAILGKSGHVAANLASEGHSIINQAKLIRLLADSGYRPQAVVLVPPVLHSIKDYSEDFDALTAPLKQSSENVEKASSLPRDRLLQAFAGLSEAFPRTLQSIRARALTSSALYGYLKVGIMGIPALRKWTLQTGLRADIDLVYKFSLDLLRPFDQNNPESDNVESAADFISAIGNMVKELFDVPFGVVLLPTPHQIYPDSFERYVNHFGLEGQDLDPLRLPAYLKTHLEKQNIAVLDTIPQMRAANAKRLTFPDDGHLNAAGHVIAGKAITDWLETGMNH